MTTPLSTPTTPSLAIVGAGAAGLAAAYALSSGAASRSADPRVAITVFEKSRGLGGRAATRWRDASDGAGAPFRWRYDHGAQYLSAPVGSPAHRLVSESLDASGLVEIAGEVWPFDDDGTIRPDLVRPEGAPRWTYRDGIASLGRRLVESMPDLDLRQTTRVARLEQTHHESQGIGWRLFDVEGADLGRFDAVLLTSPSPQTLEILADSEPAAIATEAATALQTAHYRLQYAVVLAFDGSAQQAVPRPTPYALVNPTGGHAIAWLAVESDKVGRAPDGATLLLAQMSPAWTERYFEREREAVVAAAKQAIEGLIGAPLPPPTWSDTQRWRYALPDGGADRQALGRFEESGLFFAGDSIVGKGRVHLALEDGLHVAPRIQERLAG